MRRVLRKARPDVGRMERGERRRGLRHVVWVVQELVDHSDCQAQERRLEAPSFETTDKQRFSSVPTRLHLGSVERSAHDLFTRSRFISPV